MQEGFYYWWVEHKYIVINTSLANYISKFNLDVQIPNVSFYHFLFKYHVGSRNRNRSYHTFDMSRPWIIIISLWSDDAGISRFRSEYVGK